MKNVTVVLLKNDIKLLNQSLNMTFTFEIELNPNSGGGLLDVE